MRAKNGGQRFALCHDATNRGFASNWISTDRNESFNVWVHVSGLCLCQTHWQQLYRKRWPERAKKPDEMCEIARNRVPRLPKSERHTTCFQRIRAER